jgi:hypothetical protein
MRLALSLLHTLEVLQPHVLSLGRTRIVLAGCLQAGLGLSKAQPQAAAKHYEAILRMGPVLNNPSLQVSSLFSSLLFSSLLFSSLLFSSLFVCPSTHNSQTSNSIRSDLIAFQLHFTSYCSIPSYSIIFLPNPQTPNNGKSNGESNDFQRFSTTFNDYFFLRWRPLSA